MKLHSSAKLVPFLLPSAALFALLALTSCNSYTDTESSSDVARFVSVDPLLDSLKRGEILYQRYGCKTCHGISVDKGRANPNAKTGEVVVGLKRVASGYTKNEVKRKVLEGTATIDRLDAKGPIPPFRMPSWRGYISDGDLSDLVDYVFSIGVKEKEDDW